jgi:hypothetical protein
MSDCSVARRLGLSFCSFQRPSRHKHHLRTAMFLCGVAGALEGAISAGLASKREAVGLHGNGRAHGPLKPMHRFVPSSATAILYHLRPVFRRPASCCPLSSEHGTGTLVAAELASLGVAGKALARRPLEIRAPCWLAGPPRYWRRLISRRMMLPEHHSSANPPIHASQDVHGWARSDEPRVGMAATMEAHCF